MDFLFRWYEFQLNEAVTVADNKDLGYSHEEEKKADYNTKYDKYIQDEGHHDREKFKIKAAKIADKLDIDVEDLFALMYFESRLKSNAQNSSTKATGLIQFMPSTIKNFLHPQTNKRTTIQDLKKMPNYKQLNWVYSYLKDAKNWALKGNNIDRNAEIYMLVFLPSLIQKPMDTKIKNMQTSGDPDFGEKVIEQNPAFFGKGKLGKNATKRDLYNFIEKNVFNQNIKVNLTKTHKEEDKEKEQKGQKEKETVSNKGYSPKSNQKIDVDNTRIDTTFV